jgi:hypothetical protein
MINRDQLLIVRDNLRSAASIRENIQLDLATKYTAIFVDCISPELISLLESLAIGGEVARK